MPVHDWTRVDAGIFHSFHVTFVALLGIRLNEILPPDYYALAEKKSHGLEPDVLTLDVGGSGGGNGTGNGSPVRGGGSPGGGLSLATAPPKVEVALSRPTGYPQRVLAIRERADDRVVAMIEVVSPGNKASQHGFRAFVDKAVEFLARGVHVHVIDLLPPTPRDPRGIHGAVWDAYAETESPPLSKPLTVASYAAGEPERAFVTSVAVGDVLPDLPLILESDLYVPVPLEGTYMAAFAGFPRRWRDVLTAGTGGSGHGT
ncbi:MAG: DUF4058 family protein [Zavarzinella sp.]|nr:DUF4058 family protein [Zavarzinella sp.]